MTFFPMILNFIYNVMDCDKQVPCCEEMAAKTNL